MNRNEAKKIIDDAVRQMIEEAGPTDATAIVCMQAGAEGFEDDQFTDCTECGVEVRFRPYMPNLPKICVDCARRMMEGSRCRS